jgi:hypothetical protein
VVSQPGHYFGQIGIDSDDLCGNALAVAVGCRTGDLSGNLEVRVDHCTP